MSTAVHPMLRKVAEALAWQDLSGLRARGIVAEVTPWRAFLPAARAAVQALMEPDASMREVWSKDLWLSDRAFVQTWQAMLLPLVEGEGE